MAGNGFLSRTLACLCSAPQVGPRSVDFQLFCDRLRTDLPGDSHGRGSFDTSARFVAGDPGARFGDTAPLEFEVTGEIGHAHWELIFEYSFSSQATTPAREPLSPPRHDCDPLSVPSLRIADGSIVTFLSLYVLSFLLFSSTSESDGQLGSPRRVHRCGFPCSCVFSLCSSPCISPPVSVP